MDSTTEDQRPTILVDTQLSSTIPASKETQYKIIIENPKMNDLKKGKSKKNVRLGFREIHIYQNYEHIPEHLNELWNQPFPAEIESPLNCAWPWFRVLGLK